jgi:hypothetical protein
MTRIQKNCLLAILTALCISASPNAKKKTLDEFEKTIDRFEAEMMRRDRENFTVGEGNRDSIRADEPFTDIQGKGLKIESAIPGGKDLENIGNALSRIDSDIDALAKDVEAFKAKAFQTSSVSNLIDIDVALSNPEKTRLKSLVVKLDGFELYSVNDSNNLPLPATVVPVFSGPLQPGNHKLQIDARIAVNDSSSSIPLNSFAYKHATSELDLAVTDGKLNKRVIIALHGPADPKDNLKITLESAPESNAEGTKETSH